MALWQIVGSGLLLALTMALAANAEDLVGRVLVKQDAPNFTETDLSVKQLAAGLAVVYRQHSQAPDLLAAEADAQHERRGVWSETCVKWSCGQMVSCDEARDALTRCGVLRLDRDGDGVPCEGLCR